MNRLAARLNIRDIPDQIIYLWRHTGLTLAGTSIFSAISGVLVGWILPRGPATTGQALVLLLASLLLGFICGLVLRSHKAIWLVPIIHILAIEITRLGISGPTVDRIRFDGTFPILAMVLGRGFHGLISILPMMYAAEIGVALAFWLSLEGVLRRPIQNPGLLVIRWLPGALLLLALVILLLIPGSTPPILGADGKPLPNSIAELRKVTIDGKQQGVLIRGYDVNKPVLLYLSGGPGQSSLPYPRVIFDDLSKDFVVVSWDQRGAGTSYAALDPTDTLTLERTVDDAIEMTNYLRDEFDEEKIYLLGESWGTTLGVLAAQKRPDLYYGYIGSGQMVSQRVTDQRLYHDLLDYADRVGDTALKNKMLAYGEPPYQDFMAYGFVMTYYEKLYKPYTPPADYIALGSKANLGFFGINGSEYNLVDKVNVLRGLLDMASVLYPRIQQVDFRQDVTRLDVPVYILDGEAELAARRDIALEWYDMLDAPIKRIYSFKNAAHAVAFEQFSEFHRIMLETVVPETYGK